jgi:hypothetical protein
VNVESVLVILVACSVAVIYGVVICYLKTLRRP